MSTGLLDMPAKKSSTLPVKLHMDVIESARIVSAFRGEPMQDMLSNILRPILAKMEQQEMDKRRAGQAGAPEKPKRKGGE